MFLSLHPPYRALKDSSIGHILFEAITLADLGGKALPLSFRPTGATFAIDGGIIPHVVQHLGRWKLTDVFFKHCVHSKTPGDFADTLL